MSDNMETKRFLGMIDLDRRDLAPVKSLVGRGCYREALEAYRDRFVERASGLDLTWGEPGELPGFWLWSPTKAEELVATGTVATLQYGQFEKVTRYAIGLPGHVEWNKVPEDGYNTVLRDLASMFWTGPLAAAYKQTGDPAYLRAFLGYWHDFARNWLLAHQRLMRDGAVLRSNEEHVRTSIAWAGTSKLYFGWRLNNLFTWLAVAASTGPEQAKKALDASQLAGVLLHVVDFEIPGALRGLESVGVPNQFIVCGQSLLRAAIAMQDFQEADRWMNTAIDRLTWYVSGSGYLADGTDMEQSFNYNRAVIPELNSFTRLVKNNPPLRGRDLPSLLLLQQAHDWRVRFLAALRMPDGRMPDIGSGVCPVPGRVDGNNWGHSREEAVREYERTRGKLPPLDERIANHLFGDRSLPEPPFTSIVFPYGGYTVFRTGWTPESLYSFMKSSRPAPGHMREGGNGLVVSGYGRYLLVNSAADDYVDKGIYNRYFHSTISQNSVSVDGWSQVLNARKSEPDFARPIQARRYQSDHFDLAEGFFDSNYGGWNFRTGESAEAPIDDVRHERQTLFLRHPGIWIVTDRLLCPSTHNYSQAWCFSPEFAEGEVDLFENENRAITRNAGGANVELRWFAPMPVAHRKYFGLNDGTTALGWRAKDWDEKLQRFAPAVDVHTEWRGSGDQLLVTVIAPFPSAENCLRRARNLSGDGVTGCALDLADGTGVTYLASLSPRRLETGKLLADATALLVVTGETGGLRGIVLDCGRMTAAGQSCSLPGPHCEIEWNGAGLSVVAPIRVPAGFRWAGSGSGAVPVYEG